MATIKVTLPEPVKEWADSRAQSGSFSSTADYVRDLIERDREHHERIAAVQRLVDEGLASGISNSGRDDLFETARRRVAG